MGEKLYGGRNPMQQDRMHGGIFSKHMEHMTSEGLFEKGAIAMELAHRDIRIQELEDALRWFCSRVEAGEVRSKRTYERFRKLLEKTK